ncbi:MAG: DpnD/PcfM family protein [Melioribacteraceae bacterium]
MKTFEIEITETLQTVQKVKANNYEEAYSTVNNKYKNEEIILGAEEYADTEITPYLYSEGYKNTIENPQFKNYILQNAEKILLEMSTEELIKLSFGDIENAINSFKNT